ncbi:MAG TPA: hypothetical protein VNE39_23325 [Planctomycetota bacterium]|nr:hypothetical protein [Planctomycetota bacterium]
MARRGILLGLLIALAAAAPCRGAMVRWYDEYTDGFEAAKKTGRPMVVVFGVEDEKTRGFSKKLFEKDQLAPFHRLFVFIYIEVAIKGGVFSHGLFSKFPPGGGGHTLPIIFFADAEEKVVSKVEGGQRTSELASEMASVLKKTGVASPRKVRDAQEALEQANALNARKHYGAAARLYKEVIDLNLKLPGTETAKKELARIDEMAKKQLQSARNDIADKVYPDAVRKLLDLEATFSPLPEAREAQEELARLRKMPEVREALEKAEKKEAVAARTAPKPTDDPSDIEGDFFTEEELDALDRMAGGEEPKAAQKGADTTAECRRLLSFARGWIANKQTAKAREALDTILAKHPDTVYADQAKALLEKLR